LEWARTAELLFKNSFAQDMGSVRYVNKDVEEMAETVGLTLAEQIRPWEQDELRRNAQEQGRTNTLLGTHGLWHHRDHLGPGLAGCDESTFMNGGIEDDQTHTRNLGAGLTGQRMMELRGDTDKVVRRFVDEALGQPDDTQVTLGLPWS
jgi:hypothetical protein